MSNRCPYEDTDVAPRYLTGGLSEAEQQRFEEHYFECDDCFAEVTTGAEIRAAGVRAPSTKRPRHAWYAAAAAILAAVVSLPLVYHLGFPPPEELVWRSAAPAPLSLELTTERDQWTLRWDAHPEAVEYRIELFSDEGVLLLRRETIETELIIDRGSIPPESARNAVYVRFRALGPGGAVLNSSELQRIQPHE